MSLAVNKFKFVLSINLPAQFICLNIRRVVGMSVFDEKVTEESLVGMTLPNQGRNVDIFRGKMEYKKATMR